MEVNHNEQLAIEWHKPIIRNFKKRTDFFGLFQFLTLEAAFLAIENGLFYWMLDFGFSDSHIGFSV